MKEENKVFD